MKNAEIIQRAKLGGKVGFVQFRVQTGWVQTGKPYEDKNPQTGARRHVLPFTDGLGQRRTVVLENPSDLTTAQVLLDPEDEGSEALRIGQFKSRGRRID